MTILIIYSNRNSILIVPLYSKKMKVFAQNNGKTSANHSDFLVLVNLKTGGGFTV